MLVSELLRPGKNNFDLFRLIAALLVIYGHAAGLVLIPNAVPTDFVASLLRFDYSGSLAVKFFFMLSGLLVTSSLLSNPHLGQFVIKRAARILPGLFICLCVSVFIVGPWFTTLSMHEYFSDSRTWAYLKNNFLLYQLEWRLPGVFEDSKYGLNGSLWTLPLEVVCYLFLAGIYGLGIWRFKWLANLLLTGVVLLSFFLPHALIPMFANSQESHLLPGCFAIGALFATNQDSLRVGQQSFLALLLLTALLWTTSLKLPLFYVTFFYGCLFIGTRKFLVERLRLPVDASYGVYIYGFLVQQCVGHLFPTQGILFNQVVSACVAIALGVASWVFVEKPVVQWVKRALSGGQHISYSLPTMREFNYANVDVARKYLQYFVVLVLLAWLAHILSLSFIFPGYYSPLSFHHSDFYIPASFAYAPGDAFSFGNLLNWPRPLCMWFAKFIGYFGHSGSVAWIVGVVFLNAALSALMAKHWLKLKFDLPFVLCFLLYCYALFTQPFFYTFYTQDFGSQLSYLLLLVGAFCFVVLAERDIRLATIGLFICSVCAFLTKETYVLAFGFICFCWFLYHVRSNPIKALMPGLAIFSAGVISLLVNFKTKSVFVNLSAGAGTSYHISISPHSVFKELWSYFTQGITPLLFVVMVLVIYKVYKIYKDKWLTLAALSCLIFAILAWLPNAMLPNHHYEGYSFNGIYVCCLMLFFALKLFQENRLSKPLIITLVALVLISPLGSYKKFHGARNTWVLAMEQIQTNMRAGFNTATKQLPAKPSQLTVLVSGITSPFHPFAFAHSIRSFPNGANANYIFVVPTDFPNNLGNKIDLVQYVSAADVQSLHYDQEWKFDEKGRLIDIVIK